MDLNRTNTGVIVKISCPNPFDYCLELFSLTYKNTNTLLCLSSNRSRQISVMHSCGWCLSTSKQPKHRINRLYFIVFSHSAHCNVCWHLRCHHPLLLKCHYPPFAPSILKPTHAGTKKVKCEWSGAGDLSESFHERGQSLTSLPPDPLYPATSKHSVCLLSEAAKRGGWRALLLLTGVHVCGKGLSPYSSCCFDTQSIPEAVTHLKTHTELTLSS